MKTMKAYLLLLLTLSVLVSGLSVGCAQSQADKEFKQFREGLVKLHQMKLNQLEQVNGELISLKSKIDEKEQELKRLDIPLEFKSVSKMTGEELAGSFSRPAQVNAARIQLAQLREQERALIDQKLSLEEEIKELEILLGKR